MQRQQEWVGRGLENQREIQEETFGREECGVGRPAHNLTIAIWTIMIRHIQSSDWPSIARIQAESYPREVLESLESLQSHWYVSVATCLVAEVQGAVVGYILAHPWIKGKIPPLNETYSSLPTNCDSLFIHDLALSPLCRGSGIGDELVQAVFKAGAELGLTHFSLISVQGSAGFWKRFGFKNSPPTVRRIHHRRQTFLPRIRLRLHGVHSRNRCQ